jgi:hypothetical protein
MLLKSALLFQSQLEICGHRNVFGCCDNEPRGHPTVDLVSEVFKVTVWVVGLQIAEPLIDDLEP